MYKLISFILLAAVLISNVEGRVWIEKFQLDIESTNGLLTYDLTRNKIIDLDGPNISQMNFTCSACGSPISRIAIKRDIMMLNVKEYVDRNINCTRIEYVTEEAKKGRYYCEVEETFYKTVRALVRLRLKFSQRTTVANNMINSTEWLTVTHLRGAGRLDSNSKMATESVKIYLLLGLLFFAALSTINATILFIYRKKYRRYRYNFIRVSRRMAGLNDKSRYCNVQPVEDVYPNTNLHNPRRREDEPLYVNNTVLTEETVKDLSKEGPIYLSLC